MTWRGFPHGAVAKNPPADAGEVGLILEFREDPPGVRNCNPL